MAGFNKKKTFHQQTGLKFKEETSNVLHLELHMVLEKDADQLDQSYEK